MDTQGSEESAEGLPEKSKRGDFWRGRHHSDEAREKMRKAWERRRLTFVPPMKGKHWTEEQRKRLSEGRKGIATRTGIKHTLETRAKISKISRERCPKGAACHSYKDGRYAERMSFRRTAEYKRWRFDVYSRDKFSCQLCGDNRGGNLNAHHIFSYAEYPDLRINLDNGITLCELCHDSLHFKPDSIRVLRRKKGLIRTLRILKRKR